MVALLRFIPQKGLNVSSLFSFALNVIVRVVDVPEVMILISLIPVSSRSIVYGVAGVAEIALKIVTGVADKRLVLTGSGFDSQIAPVSNVKEIGEPV